MAERTSKQIYFQLAFDAVEPQKPDKILTNQQEIANLNNQYQQDLNEYQLKLYQFYKQQYQEQRKYQYLTNINQFDFSKIGQNVSFWLYTNINESNQDYTILFQHIGCYNKKREIKIKNIRYQQSVFKQRDINVALRIVKFHKIHDQTQLSLLHFIPLQNTQLQLKKNKQDKNVYNQLSKQYAYDDYQEKLVKKIQLQQKEKEIVYQIIESDDSDTNALLGQQIPNIQLNQNKPSLFQMIDINYNNLNQSNILNGSKISDLIKDLLNQKNEIKDLIQKQSDIKIQLDQKMKIFEQNVSLYQQQSLN